MCIPLPDPLVVFMQVIDNVRVAKIVEKNRANNNCTLHQGGAMLFYIINFQIIVTL